MGRYASNRQLKSQSYSIQLPQAGTAFNYGNPAVLGAIRFNVNTNSIQYYDAAGNWQTLAITNYYNVVKDSSATPQGGGLTLTTPTGTLTTFTMSYAYNSGQESNVLIFVGNIFQQPGVSYTFNGTTTVTFTTAPPLGQSVTILHNPNLLANYNSLA
jgi:hypothetical protein